MSQVCVEAKAPVDIVEGGIQVMRILSASRIFQKNMNRSGPRCCLRKDHTGAVLLEMLVGTQAGVPVGQRVRGQ